MTDWGNLPFAYHKTLCNIRFNFIKGTWGSIEKHTEETIAIHMAASSLNYGQECFEGLKAYRGKDNKIRIFRWEENFERLNKSALRLSMQAIPKDIFKEALFTLVKENAEFVPPYGTGASLYIRPLYLGMTGKLGLSPSEDYICVLFCSPVGPYFKTGFKPVEVIIERLTDRAAPLGTGNVKVGGNYAAAMATTKRIQELGYSSALYLDPKEKKYIDECGPANFFAIKGNSYITPESDSILQSITNKSLMQLAQHIGLQVEKRKIPLEELASFEEAAQCGTAAVISPIYNIFDPEKNISYSFGSKDKPGEVCTKLYNLLTGIQFGDVKDEFGWISILDI